MEKKKEQLLHEKHRTTEEFIIKNEACKRHKHEELSKMWEAKQACLSRLTEHHEMQERRAKQDAMKRDALRREREQRRQTMLMRNKDAAKKKAEKLRDRWVNKEKIAAKMTSERRKTSRLIQLRKSLHAKERRERALRRKKEATRVKQLTIMVNNISLNDAAQKCARARAHTHTHTRTHTECNTLYLSRFFVFF